MVPAGEHGGKGGGTKGEIRASDIAPQRLSEFRKLAEIPIEEFKKSINVAKAKEAAE